VLGVAEKMPLPDDSSMPACSAMALHHLAISARRCTRYARVVRSGGAVLVTGLDARGRSTPGLRGLRGSGFSASQQRFLDAHELGAMMAGSGITGGVR